MSQTKPFFIPQKEFDLINQMNEELIDENALLWRSHDLKIFERRLSFPRPPFNP